MVKPGQFCFSHPLGKDIYLYTLTNANGTKVRITNYGAIVLSYEVKLSDHSIHDIVLGFDDVHHYLDAVYMETYPYMGAAIGRYANRIKNARFELDGKIFNVSKNWGPDQLHGGFEGFDKKVWDLVSFDKECNILQLKYRSMDGEEGFPGNLDVDICFELNDDNDLIYEYSATCDQPTPVNLAQHSYFNLNNGQGTVANHEVKIYSDKILEQDKNLVTTGNYVAVENTKYDFTEFHSVGERLDGGYDQSFVLDKETGHLSLAAEVISKASGLKLQVFTTEPVTHFYTAQGLPELKGKNQTIYGPYSGLCLETQKHPNAVNIPKFPNTILRPGEKYHQKNVYKVSVLAK